MSKPVKRPLITAQRVLLVLILLIIGAGGTVYLGASAYEKQGGPHPHEQSLPTPTPHAPRGRRWYFEAPLWTPPEQAQP